MSSTPLISHGLRDGDDFENIIYPVDDLPPLPDCGNCTQLVTHITQTIESITWHHPKGDFCMAVSM